jgi:ribosomal protein L23
MKPVVTEKAVMKIETENMLTFKVETNMTKIDVKKEVESLFDVKVDSVNTKIIGSTKVAYVKLNKKNLAIDVATKLGML